MAYVFNSGLGGVICDACRILVDQGLSYKEYEEIWGKENPDGDFCMSCKSGGKKRKRKRSGYEVHKEG